MYIYIRKVWESLIQCMLYNCSYTQGYFTTIRNEKWCFKVKNQTDRNENYFPYFLNMQKIFCFKRNGHAWHWNIIFVGCTIADVCPNCKCNGFCLRKKRKEKIKKQQCPSSLPHQIKDTLENFCNHFLPHLFFITSQLICIPSTWNSSQLYTTHFWTRKRPLFSLKAPQVMNVKMI